MRAAGRDELARPLAAALEGVREATGWLQAEHGNDPDAGAAGATPYLRMLATTLGGFLLARAALAARGSALAEAKLASAQFYVEPAAAAGGRAARGGHRRVGAAARGAALRTGRRSARSRRRPARRRRRPRGRRSSRP